MSSRARNKLTALQVKNAKLGLHSDGGGLYLRVRESGRSWFYIGSLHGKRIELGLGSALDVDLSKAREKRDKVRALTLEGIDPRVLRKASVEEARPKVTFGDYAMQYLDGIEGGFRNIKHQQQWRNTLTTYAAPIFKLPIEEVATSQIVDILQPIWLTKPETASRVRGRIERVLDAAKAIGHRDGENPARWRGHLDKLLAKRRSKTQVRHHPALPHAELPAFMIELRKRTANAARALEFAILTAARSGEVRGMTWAEVDLGAKLWTVPKERMKASEKHEVPLSGAALAVLKAVKRENDTPEDFVFEAPRGGALSDMSMTQLLKRMDRPDITVHGFRSTFRDWAGDETDFGREEVEMALAHTVASKTEAAYRRGRALEKRRGLMSAWADYCGQQEP
ncbi:tyrosine-type recombinase/integrase [Parablastomonas sp. CN1-191]|uniref:tyrosine-type recombinase/integrase n=1 Tax=Parablastomonas sp. CN1-191 TaxID=3400908 RepID=UPI003BF860E2